MSLACKYDILASYDIGSKYLLDAFGKVLILPLFTSRNLPA